VARYPKDVEGRLVYDSLQHNARRLMPRASWCAFPGPCCSNHVQECVCTHALKRARQDGAHAFACVPVYLANLTQC